MYIETVYLKSWRDYVDLHQHTDVSTYIFRGQSNSISPSGDFIKWRVDSSFNRFYSMKFSMQFASMLNQQLDPELFNNRYQHYTYTGIENLATMDALRKCIYLQHYGIPTCLIDFTSDPLIALYFAMSAIQGTSGGTYDTEGNCIHFSNSEERDYVSIYRLNCSILKEQFKIKEINSENFDSFLTSYTSHYHLSDSVDVKFGLILNPFDKKHDERNYNLIAQKGCFLLFDNEQGIDVDSRVNPNVDLIRFLEIHEKYRKVELPEPVVTIFNIGYNSFMNSRQRFNPDGTANISAFEFLKRKDLIGRTLFNDIQGLKYDFSFFHSR